MNWLKHNWDNRRPHAYPLLSKVRLGLVSTEKLKEVITDDIQGIPECKELVNHVLQLQSDKESTVSLAATYPELFTTRSTVTVSNFTVIFLMMHWQTGTHL